MKKKKIFISIASIFLVGYIYFYAPIGADKMEEIFRDYMRENIENYQDFKEVSFGLYEGPTTPGERGYAGVGQYYEIEYAHKDYEWIRFYISTNGYKLESNYEEELKRLEYIDVATNLFHEKIDKKKLILNTVYCAPRNLEGEKRDDFQKDPATAESILKYIEIFQPEITLSASNFTYEELISLDNNISKTFPKGSHYEIRFKNGEISRDSSEIQKFKRYEDLKNL